jgi:ferredoxin
MKVNGKTVLLCDCEGTIGIDEKSLAKLFDGQDVVLNTHLCRSQIENFSKVVSDGEAMIVACTQEAPLFIDVAAETGGDTPMSFTNIRERAGWSDEAKSALPKIKALISEATLDAPLTTSVVMNSEGSVLVYGSGQETIDIARQLAARLDVTCLLDGGGDDIQPLSLMDVPIFFGHISSLNGHLGAFEAKVDGYAPPQVSSRAGLNHSDTKDGVTLSTDLLLDLTGGDALVPAPEKRDGYFHPDTGNPALVQKALFDLVDLIGEFEKPRYITYDKDICVHARSAQVGCNRCIDACPTSAITPGNEQVEIDPYICAGCGSCASVCPTGAAKYQLPAGNFLFERIKLLLDSYRDAGGTDPVLLVHDTRHGEDMISTIARAGRGLPANVLPFAVNEVTQIGFDFFAVALGYGAANIAVLTGPGNRGETDGLESQLELMEAVTSGLGYGPGRVAIVDHADPDALAEFLYQMDAGAVIEAGGFIALGGKREIANLALNHLHEQAPEPVDILPLPAAAPFGAIEVNTSDCTLCLSCVSACPTGALKANPDSPQFTFTETTCVQCGLCRTICPESVITLVPRLNFTGDARSAMVVKEEEPFACIKCGEPFGVKSSIDQMVEKLSGHSMFPDEKALDRIKMCPDCRVFDVFDEADTPMVGGTRPKIVTTEDYLKERENLREEARDFMEEHGLDDTDDRDES